MELFNKSIFKKNSYYYQRFNNLSRIKFLFVNSNKELKFKITFFHSLKFINCIFFYNLLSTYNLFLKQLLLTYDTSFILFLLLHFYLFFFFKPSFPESLCTMARACIFFYLIYRYDPESLNGMTQVKEQGKNFTEAESQLKALVQILKENCSICKFSVNYF